MSKIAFLEKRSLLRERPLTLKYKLKGALYIFIQVINYKGCGNQYNDFLVFCSCLLYCVLFEHLAYISFSLFSVFKIVQDFLIEYKRRKNFIITVEILQPN